MHILLYSDFDPGRHRAQVDKVLEMLARDDLRSAEVKKLAPTGYYRAKLNRADRLLFKIVRHGAERAALVLELIENHAYDKSRFLRGARIDEDKIPVLAPEALEREPAPELAYFNHAQTRFHLLDKPLTFDEAQEQVWRLPPPLILIGPAGSGKTALVLEKLKLEPGEVLYVTRSPYLAEHARTLYHAFDYENARQEADFLSFREYLATFGPLAGRELAYPAFRAWFERHRRNAPTDDAHRLFEELQGVLTGGPVDRPWLSREEYLNLGVRQSIFADDARERVYDLFEKYLEWLKASGVTDPNLAAHDFLPRIEPRYDFAVVDEAQDLTNVQLAAVLKSLRRPHAFLLCGDSNQIVHPNFFSWSALKSLFYRDERADAARAIHILRANYRNSPQVTEVANRLLKAKQKRFGSIDRESNYLMTSAGGSPGQVVFLEDRNDARRELDEKTRGSARFAVIVMRDQDKAAARAHFRTPLLFSVQEAKGLEYENAILWNFVSCERRSFAEIAAGVSEDDLAVEDLAYARARDKSDKSLDAYKFFVNALYVAVTRAVRNLYIVESDSGHPLLHLLGLSVREKLDLARQESSREEWQREARRLELQGKTEQAETIRHAVLRERPVPWEILDLGRARALAAQALDPQGVSNKARERLFEFAVMHADFALAGRLQDVRFRTVESFKAAIPGVVRKHLAQYEARNFKPILALADAHGPDFRNPFNLTPLMMAARAGNAALVGALLDRGADPQARDNCGGVALTHALNRAYGDAGFARTRLAPVYRMLAPASLTLRVEGRLVKLDRHQGEYLLVQSFLALYRAKLLGAVQRFRQLVDELASFGPDPEESRRRLWETFPGSRDCGMSTGNFIGALESFPDEVARPERRRRAYLSHLLSKNEAAREHAYNRRLFVRTWHGRYALHPTLELPMGEGWINVYDVLLPAPLAEAGGEAAVKLAARLKDPAAFVHAASESEAPAPPAPAAGEAPPAEAERQRRLF